VIALQREARGLEKTVAEEQSALANEVYRVRCEAQDIEREAADIARLDDEVARLDSEIAGFGDPDARYQSIEAKRAAAEDEFVRLRAAHDAFKPQIERLQTRVHALTSSDASLCDYCGQPLSPGRAHAGVCRRPGRDRRPEGRDEARGRRGRGGEESARTLEGRSDRARADAQTVHHLDARRAQATQERVRLRGRAQTLPAAQERLAGLEKKLADRDFAHDSQER
jgi:hypothetical protein